MRKKKYSRGGVSKKGYKKNSPDKENDFNLIPSNVVTMESVDQNILGVGIGGDGKLESMKFMKPGKDYKFDDSKAVLEMPKYQAGGDYYDEYFQSLLESQNRLPQQPQMPTTESPLQIAPNQVQNNVQPNMSAIEQEALLFEQEQDALTDNNFAGNLQQYDPQQDINTGIQNQTNQEVNAGTQAQKDLTAPQKTQFFNPYGGSDIPSAAVSLGSSIESGNTLGIVGSGAKLLTGLGRSIVGGIGQQRANQFALDDYNEKQARDLRQYSYQEGGNALTREDARNINSSIDSVDFDFDTINSLFEKVKPIEKPETFVPDLGRYKDVGYFNVDNVQGDTIQLSTTERNPYNAQTYKDLLPYLQKQNPGKKIDIRYVNLEDGGKVSQEQILTDEFSGEDLQGINANIEKGEYRNDGENVTEVIGKTHEQGGVDVSLGEEESILSDHTKIGKDTAKMVADKFELEVKAKSTYADVLDKFKKKSGLDKITEEMTEVMDKIEKQTKEKDSSAKTMNMEFLSKKLNELEGKKKPLETAKKMLYDRMFDIQESKKPKVGKPQETFQVGGKMFNNDQIVEYGKKFGIEPERAKQLIMELGGKLPEHQDGKGFAKSMPEGQSQDKKTGLYGGLTQDEYFELVTANQGWFDFKDFDPKKPEDVKRFQETFNKLSTDGKQIKVDGKLGQQTVSARLPFSSEGQVVLNEDGIVVPELATRQYVPQEPVATEDLPKDPKTGAPLVAAILPDNYPIMPSTLDPVLKNQRRYGRIDATLVDPSQELGQIGSQQQAAISAVNQRPDASRNATIAQIAANSQSASSQAITAANRQNQQAQQRADAFNIRQGDREVDAGAQDALSYEQRILTGVTNTENDIRDFFQNAQATNIQNSKTIQELNYLNALNDKFQFNGAGFDQIGKADTQEEMLAKIRLAQAQQKLRWGGKRRK